MLQPLRSRRDYGEVEDKEAQPCVEEEYAPLICPGCRKMYKFRVGCLEGGADLTCPGCGLKISSTTIRKTASGFRVLPLKA